MYYGLNHFLASEKIDTLYTCCENHYTLTYGIPQIAEQTCAYKADCKTQSSYTYMHAVLFTFKTDRS